MLILAIFKQQMPKKFILLNLLSSLNLQECNQITGAGLKEVAKLKQLPLSFTKVTREGVAELRHPRPLILPVESPYPLEAIVIF